MRVYIATIKEVNKIKNKEDFSYVSLCHKMPTGLDVPTLLSMIPEGKWTMTTLLNTLFKNKEILHTRLVDLSKGKDLIACSNDYKQLLDFKNWISDNYKDIEMLEYNNIANDTYSLF